MIIKVFPSKMPTFRVSPGLPKVRPAAPGHAPS
jgi:hypothetical protein